MFFVVYVECSEREYYSLMVPKFTCFYCLFCRLFFQSRTGMGLIPVLFSIYAISLEPPIGVVEIAVEIGD